MRKITMDDKDKSQHHGDMLELLYLYKGNFSEIMRQGFSIYESEVLDLMRYGFIQTEYVEIVKKQKELENDIRKFFKVKDMKAFNESCMEYESLSRIACFVLGNYKKIFEQSLHSSKFFQHHMTVSDCFSIYCWISDSLVSFLLNNKDIKISHDVIVYIYNLERKNLDSVFEEYLKDFTAEKSENNSPISETMEYMIKKNKLLPDLVTKKYTASGSTPDTIAWLKLKNLDNVFPPTLFHAMINTKCKPWIIKKYYRDI